MHKFPTILFLGLLALGGFCSPREAALFRPWCWENAKHAREYLGEYRHVLVARVDEHSWEDLGPHRLTPHHFKATVVTTYKGDWRFSERISFVHHVDSPAPAGSTTNGPTGDLMFIFTNEHTKNEIGLDTGEWGAFREELAPGLEYLYPERSR